MHPEAARAALDRAEADAAQAKSAATARAYRADLADFRGFCAETGLAAFPASPETVAAFLSTRAATHSHATLRRRLAAIGAAQAAAGFPWLPGHPIIRDTLRGIARRLPARSRPAGALTTDLNRRLAGTDDHPTPALLTFPWRQPRRRRAKNTEHSGLRRNVSFAALVARVFIAP